MEQSESKRDFKEVYTVVEGKDGKEHWQRVGAAFENRDGSETVLLNAMPLNGRLVIRERRRFEEREDGDGRRENLGLVRFHGREPIGA